MQTRQTVAIIGATGKMGKAIAKSICNGNYRLLLFSRSIEKSGELADELNSIQEINDTEAIDCSFNACWEADIIILAIPYLAEAEVAEKIRDVATQKVVISISNPVNRIGSSLTTPPGTSAGEELQELLPYSKIIKAFNTNIPDDFKREEKLDMSADCFLAGNDPRALELVSELVKATGLSPKITGELSASQTLEQMHLLLVKLLAENKLKSPPHWNLSLN